MEVEEAMKSQEMRGQLLSFIEVPIFYSETEDAEEDYSITYQIYDEYCINELAFNWLIDDCGRFSVAKICTIREADELKKKLIFKLRSLNFDSDHIHQLMDIQTEYYSQQACPGCKIVSLLNDTYCRHCGHLLHPGNIELMELQDLITSQFLNEYKEQSLNN